jgi:chemotaxis protein MotB
MQTPQTRFAAAFALLALPLAGGACVRVETYDDAVYQMQAARADAAQKAQQLGAAGQQLAALQAELGRLGRELAARDQKLAELGLARANDQKKIDDLVALNSELGARLKSLGKGAEALADERGALAKALADTRARLEELRKQQAAAEARAAAFKDLAARFQKLVDAGQLKVAMRGGRMILVLSNDVLFDSGRPDLKEDGKKTLGEVARVLRGLHERRFQVAGHTDNVAINTQRFPSNWELSAARAVAVVKLFLEQGMEARHLSAAGYGEFDPVAPNEAPEGRAKNRRIEIALVPNLEELVHVPGVDAGK